MGLYSVEAIALRGPWRVCMISAEIQNTFLESLDILLSLVSDPNWYLKVDQISPTQFNSEEVRKFWSYTFCRIQCGALAFHDLHLMPFLLSFFCSWPHKWMRSLRNSSQPVKSWRSFPQLENGRNWIMRPESFNASSKSTLRK